MDLQPILQGMHADVSLPITRLQDVPESFEEIEFISLRFKHRLRPGVFVEFLNEQLKISENVISVVITDTDTLRLAKGEYDLDLLYKKTNVNRPGGYEPYRLVTPAFQIVSESDKLTSVVNTEINIQTITIAGQILISRDGTNGASAFDIWKHYYGNETSTIEEYFSWVQQPANDAAAYFDLLVANFNEFNAAAVSSEQLRQTNESLRNTNEDARIVEEQLRKTKDLDRDLKEQERQLAEADRETLFDQMVDESTQATSSANTAASNANTAAGAQNTYNVTVAIPLATGSYYTKTTARAAVPAVSRKLGLVITYATADKVWYTEKYIGSTVSGWATEENWEQVPDKAQVAQVWDALSKTDIKNAEQDASIKSIEQLLSQSNMNQTAQVSSSGREIVSLQKTASNSGMEVKLEGLTAQNLVVNGDFRNGTTGWNQFNMSNFNVSNRAAILLTNGQSVAYVETTVGNVKANEKYYAYTILKATSNQVALVTTDLTVGGIIKYHSGNGTYQRISGIYTQTLDKDIKLRIRDYRTTGIDNVYIKENGSINLTTTFGAGNEPDLATCDAMFSTYFEGTKSFVPTGRIQSIGKNLLPSIDQAKIVGDRTCFIDMGSNKFQIKSGASVYFPKKRVKMGETYFYSHIESATTRININLFNTKGDPLSTLSTSTNNPITISENGYIELRIFPNSTQTTFREISNWQLERSPVKTSYEPYRDTELYLTTPELRSCGPVKDEVIKGLTGYEYVKKVSEDVILDGSENWTTGSYELANTLSFMLSITAKTPNIQLGGYVASNLWKNIYTGLSTDDTETISAYTTGFIYVRVLKTKLPSLNLAGFKTWLSSNHQTIRYTLATPIITPIEHAGILNSAENGTVYHEPVVADAGVYGTNLTVFNTTYPISNLEEIIVHTNVDTYLDVSKAVIAADGLSFTHPDLRAGDLVLFTYFFNKEKVNGLITTTYYDGRYVIADTANGKFYKWGVKSTNGVATIQLTEV